MFVKSNSILEPDMAVTQWFTDVLQKLKHCAYVDDAGSILNSPHLTNNFLMLSIKFVK